MMRGTRIVINHTAQMGPNTWSLIEPASWSIVDGVVGKVSSRKKNGWLRVHIEPPTGATGTTVTVRNGIGVRKWDETDQANMEPKSLAPLQKLEDEAIAEFEIDPIKYMEKREIVADEIDSKSDSGDEDIEIVDPPDDAYGDLTSEQQQVIRRLIGQFKNTNKSTGLL